MNDLEEMRSWLQLSPSDTDRLQTIATLVEPHIHEIIDHFYAEIQAHPGANAVLEGPEQVVRLKRTLRRWLHEVFAGPHDEAYVERRRAIGIRHVKVGLPARYMFLAMHVIQSDLTRLIREELDDHQPYLDSLRRVLMLDLALMTGTFVEGRERVQLESLQAILVRHLRVAVFLLDDDGIVRAATLATSRLAGIDDPVGHSWLDVLPAGLRRAGHLDQELRRATERRQEVSLPRVDFEEDNTTRSFRVHLVPLGHSLASTLVQLEELTDAVQMEARLRRSEGLAQLGALSAAVSHELRNPLAGISGALQVISGTLPPDAPHRGILQKVDGEVRRLNGLVSELLAFAKPRRPQIVAVDLLPAAVETVENVKIDNPTLSFHIEGTGRVRADPDLLRQILHNLLRNAADAVDAGGTVLVQLTDGGLRVADDGPGVPAELEASIFQPFETTKTRGTGLGLAISRRNAEAMSGELRLALTRPLRGACFALDLLPG
jgi:signal transduction histidine kinase